MCVGFCRRPCRRCVFCPSRPGAACSPCWTDGHTGASPGSAAGASPSPSSTIKKVERLSSTSKANKRIHNKTHTPTAACTYLLYAWNFSFCSFFFFFFFKQYLQTGKHLWFFDLYRYTVSHIAQLFKEKGSDCWWELPIETLLPPEVLKKVRKLMCGNS